MIRVAHLSPHPIVCTYAYLSFFPGLGKNGFTDIFSGVHSMGKCRLSSLKESPWAVRNNFSVSMFIVCLAVTCIFPTLPLRNPHSWRGDVGQILSIQIKKRKEKINAENSASQMPRWYVLCSCATLIWRVMLISWFWKFWRNLFSNSTISKDNESRLPLYRQCSSAAGDPLCLLWTFSFSHK